MTVGKEDLLEEVKKIEEFKDQVKAAEKSKCEMYLLFSCDVTRGSHYVHRVDVVRCDFAEILLRLFVVVNVKRITKECTMK